MNTTEIISFFKEGFFFPSLVSNSKEEVLEELVQPLFDEKRIKSKNLVLETLMKRETLGSTGIGKGVAIPHCRTLATSDLYVVVGLSKRGIPYDAIDKKKVHLFNLIVAPPQDVSNNYLRLLGKICELVRDSKIRRNLIKAKDFPTFISIINSY
jgi:mannitol/fructose-specific phosphotransferase system IIA component (Ntr-type)